MLEQRRDFRGGNPVVGVRDVNAESHIVSPLAANFLGRHGAADQHAVADASPLLSEQLGGEGSEREAHHGVGRGVMQRRAASDVLNRVVADAARVRDTVVESRKHLARKHVGRVHRVAGRLKAIDKGAQPRCEALRVMEEQYLGHSSSVRLETGTRDRWGDLTTRWRHRYPDHMAHLAKRNRSLAFGWLLVAIQVALFLAVAFWPSSWGPAVPAAREFGGALLLLGAIGGVASAVFLGRALTPIPQPNGAGLSARGIYRWIRHPMYTSILVLCVGVAASRGAVVVWALVVTLAVFFEVKTRFEEAFLVEAYDGYASYAATTGKFVPGVGRHR